MVSNNINSKNNIPMQAGMIQPLPSMEGLEGEKIKQSVDNSYLANRVKASSMSDEKKMAATVATGVAAWYGIAQGMDKFNPMCEGAYEKSILGRVGNWGDRVATKFNGTSIGRGFNSMLNGGKNLWNKLAEKNKIIYALKNHSTKPEWAFAKGPGKGLEGFLAMDVGQVFDEFLEPIADRKRGGFVPMGKYNSFQRLEQYGLKQKEIEAFADSLKGKTFAEKALALQKKELSCLGYKPDMIEHIAKTRGTAGLEKIAHAKKLRMLGFASESEFNTIKSGIIDKSDDVIKILDKAVAKNPNLKVTIWRGNGKWGQFWSHMFGRTVSISECRNKYLATLGKGNKTGLGKFLPKALGWFMEGTTNRFAGGKLAVAMQAGIFADMLVNTYMAPKGEKGKTFAERFVNDFTYFMAMPLGIIGMHKVGGLKYAGLDTKGVENYRAALKQFNADVKAGVLSNKTLYKQRKNALNTMLKADVKNPVTKLLKQIGKFINIGNETKLAFKSTSKNNLNLLRKSGNFFRNLAGVPMRIAIPLAIVSPFIAKFTTNIAHKIFGKPTKSVLDEEKDETKPVDEKQLAAMQAAAQNQAQNPQVAAPMAPVSTQNINQQANPFQTNSQNNLLNQYQNQQQASQTQAPVIPMAPAAQPVQSQPSAPQQQNVQQAVQQKQAEITKAQEAPKKARYVPSPQGVVVQNKKEDDSKVSSAMKRFDSAEKDVMETLAMRW